MNALLEQIEPLIPAFLSDPPDAAVASASRRACEVALPTTERLAGLQDWMAEDNDAAAEFVVSELASNELAPDWRNVLIYAAESVRFRDPGCRLQAVDVLLRNAASLRRSNDQGVAEVVWCAIHRIGSIIPIGRANELAAFLCPSDPIDTRLATLQAVVRIFEVAPPTVLKQFAELAERSVILAKKHWDPDVFAAGDNSAIAIEATVATAALADRRVLELVDLAANVGRSWVMGKLQRRFDELLRFWQSASDSSIARSLVQDAAKRASQPVVMRM
ncbi:MAG: hypothetical protein ACKV2Q_21130 [Planctomycetaceae bacterium]